jgi:thymidylate synthase ThyX
MIEHGSITVKMITDRGVTHEIVRHRLASYAQESTRYCNYGKDKFGNEITVILPVWFYDVVGDNEPVDTFDDLFYSQTGDNGHYSIRNQKISFFNGLQS